MKWKCVVCFLITVSVVGATVPCPQRKDSVCPTLVNRKCRPAQVKEAHCTRSDDCDCPKVCCVTNDCKRSCVQPKSLVQGRSSGDTSKTSPVTEKPTEPTKPTDSVEDKDLGEEKSTEPVAAKDSEEEINEVASTLKSKEPSRKILSESGKEEEDDEEGEEEEEESSTTVAPGEAATNSSQKSPAKTTTLSTGAQKTTVTIASGTKTTVPPNASKKENVESQATNDLTTTTTTTTPTTTIMPAKTVVIAKLEAKPPSLEANLPPPQTSTVPPSSTVFSSLGNSVSPSPTTVSQLSADSTASPTTTTTAATTTSTTIPPSKKPTETPKEKVREPSPLLKYSAKPKKSGDKPDKTTVKLVKLTPKPKKATPKKSGAKKKIIQQQEDIQEQENDQSTIEPFPKPTTTTPPPDDDIIINREVIVKLMSVIPKLLRSFYRGRTVPPLVVKLTSGEYIYVPPLPGYDSNKRNIGQAAKLFNPKQRIIGQPWHKYLKNTRPFTENSPGPHLYPIFMTLTHPGDVFNRFPEQNVPAIEEFFFRMYPPVFKPKPEEGFVLIGPLSEERPSEAKPR